MFIFVKNTTMEKTAVQWCAEQQAQLFNQVKNGEIQIDEYNYYLNLIIEGSLVKEREQIRSSYIDGQDDILEHCKCKTEYHLNSLHYYQKKFNK